MRSTGNIRVFSMCTAGLCLLLSYLSSVAGVKVEPCDDDGLVEVLADQKTTLTCRVEGYLEWRLRIGLQPSDTTIILASCTEDGCNGISFKETFAAHVRDSLTKTITINPENNTKIRTNMNLVNGFIECVHTGKSRVNNSAYPVGFDRCGLNYVYPAEKVSCESFKIQSAINVSCIIGSVYSSRRLYRCHLFLRQNESADESLEIVDMLTSPTDERITENEVKVSGSCQFNTTLPQEIESYDLYVSVSPGGRNYSVTPATEDKCITQTTETSCIKHTTDKPSSGTSSYGKITVVVTVIVLVIILFLICLVIKKKRKDYEHGVQREEMGIEATIRTKIFRKPSVVDQQSQKCLASAASRGTHFL
ncbi:uncharacterized protein LOC112569637 isoform X2 [Pomacea canaliculata]|uniref:uncharacterized protein LOC112569637 isoform X2 n=1 Tax=Pomacea canaliculata TaxID=400727 RepID=UPI000D7260BD|nr:uncharacterized protein LOC112569637 isoform X2 [Pomacea canaliculata]